MFRICLLILLILSFSLPARAHEAAAPHTSASSADEHIKLTEFKASGHLVNDLLLFYEYDDIIVDAPSRRPTKLRHVAENISVITAEDIAEMNAHSVNEILKTVSSVDVLFRGAHFGGSGRLGIQGSDYEHVLLLLDGVRLNTVDSGYPAASGVPVQIIDRIEIIKGPASSAWGSSLGGVINIITKDTGRETRPAGTLYSSYGEGPSGDYRADAAGRAGNAGYYLYGGHMDSDGLVEDRYFNSNSYYGKVTADPAKDVSLTFTAGYWSPDYKDLNWPEIDFSERTDTEEYIITGKLQAVPARDLRLDLGLYYRGQDWRNHQETLSGVFIEDQNWDNELWGGSAGLTWEKGRHTMLLGGEFSVGENDRTWHYASSPPFRWGKEKRRERAVYFNDTIKFEKLTITPGLRYDHLSIVGASYDDIISPSLGATYRITGDTLLRATAARGFIRPGIALTVGGPGYPGDPDLEPEEIWSFQAGIETTRFKHTRLKADVFYHHQKDAWVFDDDKGIWTNGGASQRTGFDLNAAASPFKNFTGSLGYTHVRVEPDGADNATIYNLNTKLRYGTDRTGSLTLFGRYFWLSHFLSSSSAKYDDMIWDLHYNKDMFSYDSVKVNMFFSVRNLFNGSHYWIDIFQDPDRWAEAGVRAMF